MNDDPYYYVRLKITVWPEIYGDERPILFPTFPAAIGFAQGNLSAIIPQARVYSPNDELMATLNYGELIAPPQVLHLL